MIIALYIMPQVAELDRKYEPISVNIVSFRVSPTGFYSEEWVQ